MGDVEVSVDRPANGGSCVGRIDGRVVFCRLSLPGETVTAQVTDGGPDRRFWRADAVEVVANANPGRTESTCPAFVPGGCGGCSWLHAVPDLQLDLKTAVLREALQRGAGLADDVEVHAIGTDSGWRTRLSLHVADTGRAGFHAARSNRVVPVDGCLQADPRLRVDEVLAGLWPPGSTIQLAVSEAGRSLLVTGAGQPALEGPHEHVDTVRGRAFRRAVDGFWQSHRDAARILADRVVALVQPRSDERIVDLYSGVGLFGLTLADEISGGSITLVEGDPTAADYAQRNAGSDSRIRVIPMDARRWAGRPRVSRSDVIVLDPPRAGAGATVMKAIARSRPRVIVYVSCDPTTLARDLTTIGRHGYCPDRVEGLDLFPGTAHVETIVRLTPCAPGQAPV